MGVVEAETRIVWGGGVGVGGGLNHLGYSQLMGKKSAVSWVYQPPNFPCFHPNPDIFKLICLPFRAQFSFFVSNFFFFFGGGGY